MERETRGRRRENPCTNGRRSGISYEALGLWVRSRAGDRRLKQTLREPTCQLKNCSNGFDQPSAERPGQRVWTTHRAGSGCIDKQAHMVAVMSKPADLKAIHCPLETSRQRLMDPKVDAYRKTALAVSLSIMNEYEPSTMKEVP